MASVYSRLGTQVTVIEYMDNICPFLDADIADQFRKILTKQGIKFLVGHKVTGGKNNGTSGEVTVQPVKGGNTINLSADHILISTGRRPFTANLGAKVHFAPFKHLQEIGVELDK